MTRPPGRRTVVAAVAGSVVASLLLFAAPAQAEDTPAPAPSTATEEPAAAPDAGAAAEADPTPAPVPEPAPVVEPAPTVTPDASAEPETSPPVARPSRLPLRAGATGWRVQKVQERLQWLGYDIYPGNIENERMGESTAAAVKEFQAKFGMRASGVVGSRTWARLADVSGKVGRLPKSCMGERTICIDKAQRLVRLVEKGKVVLALDARFGFVGAETREGTFRVHFKSRDHTSSLYRTWMPFALFFSGGQAVHYSPYFARDGYRGASHGCVNLRDFDRARWLFDRVPLGTRVHVYRT